MTVPESTDAVGADVIGHGVVREGLFTTDPPALRGGRCEVCDRLHFPLMPSCPFCRSDRVRSAPLSRTGVVYSWTIVRMAVPGYHGVVPYGMGVVELPEGIRVTTTLIAEPLESLAVGAEVVFRTIDVGEAGRPVLSYAYEVAS